MCCTIDTFIYNTLHCLDKPEIQANSSAVGNTDAAPELRVPADLVRELHCPSLETFSTQHFYPRIPVKITGKCNGLVLMEKSTSLGEEFQERSQLHLGEKSPQCFLDAQNRLHTVIQRTNYGTSLVFLKV